MASDKMLVCLVLVVVALSIFFTWVAIETNSSQGFEGNSYQGGVIGTSTGYVAIEINPKQPVGETI